MPFRSNDNTNALAPEPYPGEKKESASTYEDGEFELEEKEQAFAPDVPELLKDITPAERAVLEKKLVRKIDLRLLPMVGLSNHYASTE